jgi:hypothetical protein
MGSIARRSLPARQVATAVDLASSPTEHNAQPLAESNFARGLAGSPNASAVSGASRFANDKPNGKSPPGQAARRSARKICRNPSSM